MLELHDPVSTLPKIGPKYKSLLEKLEIYNLEDLLYHFPFRYDDYSQIKQIDNLKDGDITTVEGILGPVNNIFTRYRKKITKSVVVDDTGKMELIWFNSHFLKKVLKTGKKYNFSGKVNTYNGKLSMTAPTYEEKGDNNLSTGRLVPVYPETAGLSSKWLRTKIRTILDQKPHIEEFLPLNVLKSENFQTINHSLESFHFPQSNKEANLAKKRFQFEELFLELINVESRKKLWGKETVSPKINSIIYEDRLQELLNSLPFRLTPTQEKAVDEIIDNLKKEHPMNRLLEGDVGTGKTIVAVIAAYLTYLNGYNSLYMAPTEILAKQHYETFVKFLAPLGVEIEQITSTTKKRKSDGAKNHISIGTHALLFDRNFNQVGLIVIDEQHRFGVEQRTKLVNINEDKTTPHLLTMTATPIPRTLALTLYGDLEISVLEAPPNTGKKITTKVVPEKSRDKAFEWIKKSGEQTFIVCPFIERSEHENFENVKAATEEFEKLKSGIFKGEKIGLLHGKLKPAEKQKVVSDFESGKLRVLVSTPVIEVGIDIKDAAIIVIESAERYGLASLHQLRGRVGRGDKPGYCFVMPSHYDRNSYKRLKYLEELEDGLKLAEIDMKLRGHGDIYGTLQHGFKRFKVANLTDLELLESAKKYASQYYPKLDKYPKLKKKIIQKSGQYIGNN